MKDVNWFEDRIRLIAKAQAQPGKRNPEAEEALIELGAQVLHDFHALAHGVADRGLLRRGER